MFLLFACFNILFLLIARSMLALSVLAGLLMAQALPVQADTALLVSRFAPGHSTQFAYAAFSSPHYVAVNASGNISLSDRENHRIQKGQSATPTATITGLPTSPTNQASATLTVGGEGVTTYTWKLDNGAWSAELPVAQAIPLPAPLPDGAHTIAVLGCGNGVCQDASAPTSAGWTVDTTPPETLVSGVSTGATSANAITVQVGGADVHSVTYVLDGGAATDVAVGSTFVLSGLAEGPHSLVIRSMDAAGNITTKTYVFSVKTEDVLLFFPAMVSSPCGMGVIGAAPRSLGDKRRLLVSDNVADQIAVNSRGCFDYSRDAGEIQRLYAYLPAGDGRGDASVYQALAFPGEDRVVLDASSTAGAILVTALSADDYLSPTQIKQLLGDLSSMAEFKTLVATIQAELENDIRFFEWRSYDSISRAYSDAVRQAFLAAKSHMDATYNVAAKAANMVKKGIAKNAALSSSANNVKLVKGDAQGRYEVLNQSGNIAVNNKTMFYLSAKISSLADGNVVQDHIDSLVDEDMIEPPYTGLWDFLWGDHEKKHTFTVPQSINSHIQIGTPGFMTSIGGDPLDAAVANRLLCATVLDYGLLELVSKLLGVKISKANKGPILELANELWPLLGDLIGAIRADDYTSALRNMMIIVNRQLVEKESALYRCLSAYLSPQVLARLGMRTFPVLAALHACYDAYNVSTTFVFMTTLLGVIADSAASTEWEAQWLSSVSIEPNLIAEPTGDVNVTIAGQGFEAYFDYFNTQQQLSIVLNNASGQAAYTVPASDIVVGSNSASFTLPYSFLQGANGVYSVVCTVGDLSVGAGDIRIDQPSCFNLSDFQPTKVYYTGDINNGFEGLGSLCLPYKTSDKDNHCFDVRTQYNGQCDTNKLWYFIKLKDNNGLVIKEDDATFGYVNYINCFIRISGEDINSYSGDLTLEVTLAERAGVKFIPINTTDFTIKEKHGMRYVSHGFEYSGSMSSYWVFVDLTNGGFHPNDVSFQYNKNYTCMELDEKGNTIYVDYSDIEINPFFQEDESFSCDNTTVRFRGLISIPSEYYKLCYNLSFSSIHVYDVKTSGK
ncbi:MAG: hypothetical protein ACP59X_12210 [Solidesulfovibrio sp. DCME]|uniref:hypothetical protein n=1 Tax=Solidesulfovibrio sp. DCME TaxID=3447380 RepID=UPI003D0F096F